MDKSTLVILTLNELPGLRVTWSSLPLERFDEVIVVDGGSVDGTLDFLQRREVRVLEQLRPGWGEAVRLGVEAASGTHLAIFSPDGNQAPEDVARLLDRLEAGADMVVASRFLPTSVHRDEGQFLRLRSRGGILFTRLANRAFAGPMPVSDATQTFRAFTRQTWERLQPDATGFALGYQLTLRAMRQGLRIDEVATFESPRLAGDSHVQLIPSTLEHLKVLVGEAPLLRTLSRR